MIWMSLLAAAPAFAQDDLAAALVEKGKAQWEPKGKALEAFGRAEPKRTNQSWAEAIPLFVQSLQDQPGCGKCLQGLGRSFIGAKRYDDAVKVGQQMAKLFPDHKEGPYITATAYTRARRPADAIPAWDAFLALDPGSVIGWNLRNQEYLKLEEHDDAQKALDGATKLGEGDVACFKTQIALGRGAVDDARLSFPKCDETGDVDVQRQVEGWLLLQEGKANEAQSKLAQGGAEEDTRLALALVRLSEGKFDQASNLMAKLLADVDWALDADLAQARALFGLNKGEEALKVLDARLTKAGWEEQHPKYGRNDVILFLASPHRAKDVCMEALALKILVLQSTGDTAGAEALRQAAVKVHGEGPLFPPPAAPK